MWIPKFGLMAKPLHEITKAQSQNYYFRMREQEKAFNDIKQALTALL